jgi:hypothetical protein
MNKWLVMYVALLAVGVALGMAEPGRANTTKQGAAPLTQTSKFADRLVTKPSGAFAQPTRSVRVVYPTHLASK